MVLLVKLVTIVLLIICVPAEKKSPDNCYIREKNGKVIYTGNVNRTDNGLPCGRWDQIGLKYPLGPEHVNYCRNPDHDPKGLWCYLQWNRGWRYCNIPRCDIIPHLVPPPQQPRHTPLDPGPRPGQPPTRNEATTSNTVESEITTREIEMMNIYNDDSSSGGSTSGGTAAGIIIGCIAAIAVVGLLVLFVHKRQIRPQRRLRFQSPTVKVSSSTIQRPDQEKRTGTAIELSEFNGDAVYAQVNKRNKPSNKTDVITNRSSVVSAEYSHTSFMASPENSTTSKNYGALHFDVTDGMYDVVNKKCVRNSEIDQNYDHFVKPVKGKSSNYVNAERFSKWVNEDTTDYPETLDSDIYQNI